MGTIKDYTGGIQGYIQERGGETVFTDRFGAKPLEKPENFPTLRDEWLNGTTTARAAARQLGVTHTTFIRWCKTSQA